jgi:spore coat polysaccharide biosynthesis protein SpsF
MHNSSNAEAQRLEKLWGSDFGNAYIDRNADTAVARAPFWNDLLNRFKVERALEVGCNIGANLRWLSEKIPPIEVYGVDVNERALALMRAELPRVNAIWSPARALPFRDAWFDLVFTSGVLIHQPEATLPVVMSEINRCSSKYVLCMEYFAEKTIEVSYRGQTGALFKRNYGQIYSEMFPELRLVEQNFLGHDLGWDDVTYWLFTKDEQQQPGSK